MNNALNTWSIWVSNYQCVESDGDIQLWFNAFPGPGKDINVALESCYPSVNSFNCPNH